MEDRGGSFVAVRRISQGIERGNTCHSTSGIHCCIVHSSLSLSLSENKYPESLLRRKGILI